MTSTCALFPAAVTADQSAWMLRSQGLPDEIVPLPRGKPAGTGVGIKGVGVGTSGVGTTAEAVADGNTTGEGMEGCAGEGDTDNGDGGTVSLALDC